MAPHSSTLAWKIPWMEEPSRLPSMGSHRVGHDWSDLAAAQVSSMGVTDVLRKTCTLELVQTCLTFPFLQFLAVWTGWASVYSAHAQGYCPCLRPGKRIQWHKSSSKCSFSPLLHLPPLGRDLAPGIGLVKTQRVQKWVWFGFGLVAKSCLTLCNPMNYSLPGSSVRGIFQARILEWGAIAFSGIIIRDLI